MNAPKLYISVFLFEIKPEFSEEHGPWFIFFYLNLIRNMDLRARYWTFIFLSTCLSHDIGKRKCQERYNVTHQSDVSLPSNHSLMEDLILCNTWEKALFWQRLCLRWIEWGLTNQWFLRIPRVSELHIRSERKCIGRKGAGEIPSFLDILHSCCLRLHSIVSFYHL